jgi:hypothetical protein
MLITHDQDHHQFTCDMDGKISHLKYAVIDDGKVLDYKSTYVPSELRGQNIATELVKVGLAYAREQGYKIIPSCSFVRAYMERHPEYDDLLAEGE